MQQKSLPLSSQVIDEARGTRGLFAAFPTLTLLLFSAVTFFATKPCYSRLSGFVPLQAVSRCANTQAKKWAASNRHRRQPVRQRKNNPKLFNITASYGSNTRTHLIFLQGVNCPIGQLCKIACAADAFCYQFQSSALRRTSGLSWFLQSTLRNGFPHNKISRSAPPGYKA